MWKIEGLVLVVTLLPQLIRSEQCFVRGECSGVLAGVAPENGADACLSSVTMFLDAQSCEGFQIARLHI